MIYIWLCQWVGANEISSCISHAEHHCRKRYSLFLSIKGREEPWRFYLAACFFQVRMALVAGELLAEPAIFGFLFLCATIYRAAMIGSKQMLLKWYLPRIRLAALTLDDLNGNSKKFRPFFYLYKRC